VVKLGDIQKSVSCQRAEHFDILNAFLRHHIHELYTFKMVRFFAHPVDRLRECKKKLLQRRGRLRNEYTSTTLGYLCLLSVYQ